MSPWTGQGWKQLLLCPRGITLLPEVSKDILGSCSCHWGSNQASQPWRNGANDDQCGFSCQFPIFLKSFSAHSWRNPRWGCLCISLPYVFFLRLATPLSNWEVNWEQWHLQTLGISPCCEARPRHLDDISLLASTSQKNHFNTPSLWFMRVKYSLAPQKLPSVQWVNNTWLILWQMCQVNPSPRLTMISSDF